ncbi:MAG: hypothetical protein LBN09_04310 [Clostridioides sp.]|jgi:F0F1-type ATP synthase membrane subunit b/b'|nr:hypothetical protein [Clostridioides sp.]
MKIDLQLLDLVSEVESIVKEASSLPFSSKCSVDRDEVLEIMGNIRTLIPEEINQAVWINKERQKLITEAKKEAAEIVLQANKESERVRRECEVHVKNFTEDSEAAIKEYVESSKPMQQARLEAQDIVDKAEDMSNEIKLGAMEYAQDVLESVEFNLKNLLEEVINNRSELK